MLLAVRLLTCAVQLPPHPVTLHVISNPSRTTLPSVRKYKVRRLPVPEMLKVLSPPTWSIIKLSSSQTLMRSQHDSVVYEPLSENVLPGSLSITTQPLKLLLYSLLMPPSSTIMPFCSAQPFSQTVSPLRIAVSSCALAPPIPATSRNNSISPKLCFIMLMPFIAIIYLYYTSCPKGVMNRISKHYPWASAYCQFCKYTHFFLYANNNLPRSPFFHPPTFC